MKGIRTSNIYESREYKNLTRILLTIYGLFMMVYMFREELYAMNNQYITLFVWTVPNLVPSFLFTIIVMLYVLPGILGDRRVINKSIYLLIVNLINITIFGIIEYIHVILKLGEWDNKDMVATCVGITLATFTYYKLREYLLSSTAMYIKKRVI